MGAPKDKTPDFSKRVGWRVFSDKPLNIVDVIDDDDGIVQIVMKPTEVGAYCAELVAVSENMLAREAIDGGTL